MAIKSSSPQINRDQIVEFWRSIFRYIGDDPNREGLRKTPQRIVKSWAELFSGYSMDPVKILSRAFFKDACCDEMVIEDEIQAYSFCEHHMLPFSFQCAIGYLPDKRLVGASKLARLVECYSRRLQIQERLVAEIADALMAVLKPKGVMVVIYGKHLCMLCRGIKQHRSRLITSAIRGVFKEDKVRAEFLRLIGLKESI